MFDRRFGLSAGPRNEVTTDHVVCVAFSVPRLVSKTMHVTQRLAHCGLGKSRSDEHVEDFRLLLFRGKEEFVIGKVFQAD